MAANNPFPWVIAVAGLFGAALPAPAPAPGGPEPTAAAIADHDQGMQAWKPNDAGADRISVRLLKHASALQPANARWLADYGCASVKLADLLKNSHPLEAFCLAYRGEHAMQHSMDLDPADLRVRHGLYEFYRQAPWPFGSEAKAARELSEIHRREAATAKE